MANRESYNAIRIEQGRTMSERPVLLRKRALKRIETLSLVGTDERKQLPGWKNNTERRFLLITDSEFVSGYYSDRDLLQCDKRIEYYHEGSLKNLPKLDDRFFVERIAADNIEAIQGRIIPSFSWKSKEAFLQVRTVSSESNVWA